MKWLRKLLGVDKAIQEAKDELLLEIRTTRKYAASHIHSDVAHRELTTQRRILFPKLVPYVLDQIDKGKIRTWEQYADWYTTDHTKAIEWAIVDGKMPSIDKQADWIIEATKFAHIKLPVNPGGPNVGLVSEEDPYGPVVLCPPMPCVECTGNPGCSASDGMPNPWDYDSYDPGFISTLLGHPNSHIDWDDE